MRRVRGYVTAELRTAVDEISSVAEVECGPVMTSGDAGEERVTVRLPD